MSKVVNIEYTNWKGETSWRRIRPFEIEFKKTNWHPEPQWILNAWDLDKNADRSFALKDILEWRPENGDCNEAEKSERSPG